MYNIERYSVYEIFMNLTIEIVHSLKSPMLNDGWKCLWQVDFGPNKFPRFKVKCHFFNGLIIMKIYSTVMGVPVNTLTTEITYSDYS